MNKVKSNHKKYCFQNHSNYSIVSYRNNFDQQIIDFNDIKINDQINENVNSAIKELILNRDKLQNKIYFKKLMKDFIIAYVG